MSPEMGIVLEYIYFKPFWLFLAQMGDLYSDADAAITFKVRVVKNGKMFYDLWTQCYCL
jgi:hypothetical protein